MKKYYLIIFTMLLLAACNDDFLEKQPFAATASDAFFTSEQEAVLAINAAYEQLRKFRNVENANGLDTPGLMWSHDVGEHPDRINGFGKIRSSTITPDAWSANYHWWQSYVGIQRANQLLTNLPNIEDFDPNTKERILGEAYFLRAFYYHYLSMWYGGVPIVDRLLDQTVKEDAIIPRSTHEETLAFIKSDLEEAESRLPDSYTGSDVGRATKGAARALLLKTLLWQKDYPAALTKAEEIDGMGYSLVDEYASLFDGTNENSSESVFELQFDAVVGEEQGSSLSLLYAPNGEGMVPNGGWGMFRPLEDLVDEYEVDDPRKVATIFQKGDVWTRSNGDQITFTDAVNGTGFACKKYVTDPDTGTTVTLNYAPQNWLEIRYAEVILLYAEALLRNSQKDAAIAQINRVRARPSVNLPPLIASSLTIEQAWEALYHEYRVELALEARYGYALRRWGIAAEFYAEKGLTNFVPGKHEFLPVPQAQIDFSEGTLDQNFGY